MKLFKDSLYQITVCVKKSEIKLCNRFIFETKNLEKFRILE